MKNYKKTRVSLFVVVCGAFAFASTTYAAPPAADSHRPLDAGERPEVAALPALAAGVFAAGVAAYLYQKYQEGTAKGKEDYWVDKANRGDITSEPGSSGGLDPRDEFVLD